jgi:hypothetical protein
MGSETLTGSPNITYFPKLQVLLPGSTLMNTGVKALDAHW